MNLHREAMFLEENGCLKAVNEPWGAGSPPLLWAGRTLDGSWQWRSSRILSPQIAAKLEELLKGECFEEIKGLIGASRMEQSVCCRPKNLLPDEGMVLTLAELETLGRSLSGRNGGGPVGVGVPQCADRYRSPPGS